MADPLPTHTLLFIALIVTGAVGLLAAQLIPLIAS